MKCSGAANLYCLKANMPIIIWRCHLFVLFLCCGVRRSIELWRASECNTQQFSETKTTKNNMWLWKFKRWHEEKSLQFRNRNLLRALWKFYQIILMNLCARYTVLAWYVPRKHTHLPHTENGARNRRKFKMGTIAHLALFFGGIFGTMSRLWITMFVRNSLPLTFNLWCDSIWMTVNFRRVSF